MDSRAFGPPVVDGDRLFELANEKKSVIMTRGIRLGWFERQPAAWVLSMQFRYVMNKISFGGMWEYIPKAKWKDDASDHS